MQQHVNNTSNNIIPATWNKRFNPSLDIIANQLNSTEPATLVAFIQEARDAAEEFEQKFNAKDCRHYMCSQKL